jgi:hypothetical protein
VNALRREALDPSYQNPWTAEPLLTVVQGRLLFPVPAFAWGKAGLKGGSLKFFEKLKILRFSTHKTLDVCSIFMLKSKS